MTSEFRRFVDGVFTVPASTVSKLDLPAPPAVEREALREVVRGPSYSRASFEPLRLKKSAEWAAYQIAKLDAEAIVAVGHSGLVIAGATSLISGRPVIAVRKQGDDQNAHSTETVNAALPHPAQRWVFLDDFVSSGKTLRWAMAQVWYHGVVNVPYPTAILAYASTSLNKSVEHYGLGGAVPEYKGWPVAIPQIGFDWEPGENL